ncbi:Secretion system apparatus protein SsaV [Pseudomonas ogarae]|uniref:type III secretion system export apparatus subunit SctV n=1 Tax=Pseudomonas ogarae (strain DSM 112162 / CECT 30235 / F113) TaxID=1114970 RepID=UPI000BB38517|nr:type III secretion system export apparatus subunit SctV [Pseudomonas ogarae]PBJ23577.1 Secretion system apparatus protein SsaV [Pseudomonas ogarae]
MIALLNKVANEAVRRIEVVGAFVVLGIVFMLILPLPTSVVDALIAINICISCLLIVLSLYLPRPLAFSSFPAVLLLTTLFRLALSVATTRLILLQGDAGHIVQAFGNFVVGGNLAVGLVIFLILTVVNFLVITKGSERVAEVAARFTLDALPGKQMSIDSDLRANLIDVSEARRRREELNKESQLFGAMDGAMKFVKGDAIAGLVIVVINLIGGFSVGMMQHDMGASESMHLYAVLTIGDGLIAQIPALLISLTAGMIITRVSPEGQPAGSSVGKEIAQQLTAEPKAWVIASVGMLGFAALPGMPTLVFIVIALITGTAGIVQLYSRARQARQGDQPAEVVAPAQNGAEDLRSFDPTRAYLLQFSKAMEGNAAAEEAIQAIRKKRNALVAGFGLTLPPFEIEYSALLEDDEFRFCVHEVPMLRATFGERVAVARGPLPLEPRDGQVGSEVRDEQQWLWLTPDDPLLADERVEAVSAAELLVERMSRAMFASGPQFLGLQESKSILSWLEAGQPELVQELQRTMPLARFAAVLQRLAGEGVPLRAVRLIAESLIEHGQHERDVGALTDYARIALKSQIYHQYRDEDGLHVWLLTPETEGLLRDALRQTQTETFFALESLHTRALVMQLREGFPLRAKRVAVLLVAQDLRAPLRDLLRDEFNHVPVLAFSELHSNAQVTVLGRFDLEQEKLRMEDAA